MKTIKLSVAALLVFLGLSGSSLSAQVNVPNVSAFAGVGPVERTSVDLSALNSKAKKFINKYYSDVDIKKCYKEFPSQEVQVYLANGVEIEFDKHGNVVDIDAPLDWSLPEDVVRHILPRESYRKLKEQGYANVVESITHDKYGYKIELNDNIFEEARFDNNGLFIAFYTDD